MILKHFVKRRIHIKLPLIIVLLHLQEPETERVLASEFWSVLQVQRYQLAWPGWGCKG